MGGTVTGSDVVLVAPVVSKLSKVSHAMEPVPAVVKLGAVFWYVRFESLPAAEKYATPLASTVSTAWAINPS